MILVFGGTTEGRKAVEALEAAGSRYYYSTRSEEQQVNLIHGIHLKGGMDLSEMLSFCNAHDIRLIVDAAHPFAENLHCNLLQLALQLQLPVIRFDRIYPPHSKDVIWCKDYQDAIRLMEEQEIKRLLALTGVNTIVPLRPYWSKHECWFRILRRESSIRMAREAGFPENHLAFYEEDETEALIDLLHPDALLTKESGVSGGFSQKVETAKAAGIKVFAVQRPAYPPENVIPKDKTVTIDYVNGPHGLRRTVEKRFPEFYPLHSGLTTGTCATAAAVAAAKALLCGERPDEVPVILPDGETIHVTVGYGDGFAYVTKPDSDDPDVTRGLEVRAAVSVLQREDLRAIEIKGGVGVGTFTLPGFDFPPGEPAINKGPRQMIRDNLAVFDTPLQVVISVPEGEEVAQRTFNPRLGIEGGISIIGVSGIVLPFSEDAFIDSIRKCMQVAKASGAPRVVINSGAKSERFVRARYPELPQQAFVEYGNYIGETLKMAEDLDVEKVTLGIMLGKAVKLAAGQLDTHSRMGTMDKEFISQMLAEANCPMDITNLTLARELWKMIPEEKIQDFCRVVISHCHQHCAAVTKKCELTILLIGENGEVYS
jgi:cobalt-precorrin-5B (C1)-methyltransferase